MDASDENTAKSAIAPEEGEPSNSHQPETHGRSIIPSWRKVLVYDCEQRTVKVTSERNINLDHCHKLDLPPNRRQVTIFVDRQTESKPTIASQGADGRSNVQLATLYLDHLGAFHRVLHFQGLLSTLYVMTAAPRSETSSQNS